MGLLNLLWALSMTVGPIAAGWLEQWLGVQPALVVAAGLAAGSGSGWERCCARSVSRALRRRQRRR